MARKITSRRGSALRALCCLLLAALFAVAAISAQVNEPAFSVLVAALFLGACVWNLFAASFLDETEPSNPSLQGGFQKAKYKRNKERV
jgi:hypothetical protein